MYLDTMYVYMHINFYKYRKIKGKVKISLLVQTMQTAITDAR
jgi:hypothetical protein